jgi:hypothetical protein
MAQAKPFLGIPIEKDMINVVNLAPGESAPFLFYTIHFIDLKNPIGFDKDKIKQIIKDSTSICRRGSAGLPLSYLEKAVEKSRYLLVAINNNESLTVGSILLAVPDSNDPAGIYVDASCNTDNGHVKRKNPLFAQQKDLLALEINSLTDKEILVEFNKPKQPSQQIQSIQPNRLNYYKSLLVDRRLKALNIEEHTRIKLNLRTAQLLKLTLFNYCNRVLNIKHAYNAAAGVDAAMLHARNGMTLRTEKCNQPDQLAERFNLLSTDKKKQLIESGTLKTDSSGSYPMKLCNYNFNVLFADLLHHTLKAIENVEQEGFSMDDILAVDIAF